MNLLTHLHLLKRHAYFIIIITIVCGLSGLFAGLNLNQNTYVSTLFLSISTERNSNNNDDNIYDQVQAADQFSETIQGWFKNPLLIEKIEKASNLSVDLSARKQEKQNLIVTFATETPNNAVKISNAIEQILKDEITAYNGTTSHKFNLAVFDSTVDEQSSKLPLIVIISLIFGFALSITLSYLYEYVFNIASHKNQIEDILNRKCDTFLSIKSLKKENSGYLAVFLSIISSKKHIFIGVGCNAKKIADNLLRDDKKLHIESINLPEDVNFLKDINKDHCVLFCLLGKTSLPELEKFTTLLPEDYSLVILY